MFHYETDLSSVTAAGIVIDKPFLDHKWEESMKVLNVNVSNILPVDLDNDTYSAGHGKYPLCTVGSHVHAQAKPGRMYSDARVDGRTRRYTIEKYGRLFCLERGNNISNAIAGRRTGPIRDPSQLSIARLYCH